MVLFISKCETYLLHWGKENESLYTQARERWKWGRGKRENVCT